MEIVKEITNTARFERIKTLSPAKYYVRTLHKKILRYSALVLPNVHREKFTQSNFADDMSILEIHILELSHCKICKEILETSWCQLYEYAIKNASSHLKI